MIKKKIIITGGSGYIGSSLANFLSDNCEVITLDKRKKNNFLNNKIKHFTCNIVNKKKIKNLLIKIKPDVLIHLAGQSTIDLVEKEKNKN